MWSETHRLRATGCGLAAWPAALGVASVIWLVAIFAAPYAARRAAPGSPAAVLAVGTYLVGSVICHQQARRSFHLEGVQLPVCARCTGIYLAAPFGVLFVFFRRGSAPDAGSRHSPATRLAPFGSRARRARPGGGERFDAARWRTALLLAALPTAVTVVMEWVSGTMIPGPIRFAAGLPIGFVVMWYLGVSLGRPQSEVQGPESDNRRPESSVRRPVLG
jgi:hypothetical protein